MDSFELSLLPAPTAATQARSEVTAQFATRVGARMLEDVRLLVTELITNALRHGKLAAGDRVSVKASVDGDIVRIEVGDPGRDGEVAQRAPGRARRRLRALSRRAARQELGRRAHRRHRRVVRVVLRSRALDFRRDGPDPPLGVSGTHN